jgi:hypothetical protein
MKLERVFAKQCCKWLGYSAALSSRVSVEALAVPNNKASRELP